MISGGNGSRIERLRESGICRGLRVVTAVLWIAAFCTALAGREELYRTMSMLTAASAAALIVTSRNTQGHYRNISMAYFAGCITWIVSDVFVFISGLHPGSEMLETVAMNVSFLPEFLFVAGLIFFAWNEYNHIHFEKMMLHTFAAAYLVFMVVQKLVLVRLGGMVVNSMEMLNLVLYFFVVVFTIVLVFSIFIQTGFKGHTIGTNLSAVILVIYSLKEIVKLYMMVSGRGTITPIGEAVGLLGLPIYSYAQSDPSLETRPVEPDELKPEKRLNEIAIWGNAAFIMLAGGILYSMKFFDNRDIYLIILATLAYVIVYKTVQANVYNTRLLEQQMEENVRLERMVEEKTRELRRMNEYLKQISGTDELTGLYNRRYGMRILEELVSGDPVAILLMDLNRFKHINDTYGHDVGDDVLRETGRRLRLIAGSRADCMKCTLLGAAAPASTSTNAAAGADALTNTETQAPARGAVTPVRLGGDEFLIILEGRSDADIFRDAEELAASICRAMDEPVAAADLLIPISACIGIACSPYHALNKEDLYKVADTAMYSIKHKNETSSYITAAAI